MKRERRSVILLIELLAVTLFIGIGTMMLSTIYTGTYRLTEKTSNIATANRVVSNVLEIADSCSSVDEYKKILNEMGKEISPSIFTIGYDETGEFVDIYKEKYIEVTVCNKEDSNLVEISCRCVDAKEEIKKDSKCILDISTKKYYGGIKNAN